MNYYEFLNSARKHQSTCNEIFLILDAQKAEVSGQQKAKNKQLVYNLYYLSGYIIECSIKYAIYHLISYDRKKNIKELNQDGITFSHNIKHHKYERYVDVLNIRQPGLVLIDDIKGISKEVVSLYKLWDAEVRYWYNDIDEDKKKKLNKDNILSFYKLAEKLMKEIERI